MIKKFICKLFGIKQCKCSDKDEVEQKGFPIINETEIVNRKLEKINKKHNKGSE
jgi:hypothetical protein